MNAIWLASTDVALEPSIADLLELAGPGKPVKKVIRDALADPQIAGRAATHMERFLGQFLDALTPDKAPWFDNAVDFSRRTVESALQRFEASFDRWRDLFDAAERQLNDAHRIISDHSTGSKELRAAKDRHRQAANQLELLKSRSESQSADFYTYRYLATEGFLPGYNFPRLPLLAYVPGTQDSIRKQTFLQRARFVGISEFGPRSLVYHEGRAFRVVKAMISASARADGRLATRAIEVCRECGAAHEARSRETCHACGTLLADAHLIRDVFRIANVETIPAERISINDEERQRQGFDLQTLFAWASRSGRIDVREAVVREGGQEIVRLSYGSGATITRVNKGLRRRRDQSDLGFTIDPRTGWWAKGDDEDDESGSWPPSAGLWPCQQSPSRPAPPCRLCLNMIGICSKYADWEGIPARWVPGEAWAFVKGEWVRVHDADVGMNGAELDEESFLDTFGRLMALPAIAFQARPDRWTASR